eukprot:COSAG01_NODE_68_length_28978_cov_182.027777_30_plen_36_part_00
MAAAGSTGGGCFGALRPIKIAPPVIGLADSRKLWL